MQAIILAAGMGKRLKKLTANNTKCMIRVNGETLISRMLHQIERKGIRRVIIVVGYKGEQLKEYVLSLNLSLEYFFVQNSIYDKTNNIYSLALTEEYLESDDTLLLESDLIFDDKVLDALLEDKRESLALVDKYESWMDGTCVKINDEDVICDFIPGTYFKFENAKDYYKTVNIYKFSKKFSKDVYLPFLKAYMTALGQNEYYEQVLRVISNLDNPGIFAKKLSGEQWYEIDDVQDLDIAESIFTTDSCEKYAKILTRYGGYWRYPQVVDFSLPGNPYFPTQRLKDEIKASSDQLLTGYPSGMKVVRLLASKLLGIEEHFVLIAHGIEEFLNLFGQMQGKTGVILPSREMLLTKLGGNVVPLIVTNASFSYDSREVIEFFSRKGNEVNRIILYNPGYHSGYVLPKEEVVAVLRWAKERNIQVLYDETCIDFADSQITLIDEDTLAEYKNVVILKDLSTLYGVRGLRLATMISGDSEFLSKIEAQMPCWNIDSYTEFFLQIVEKYARAFEKSVETFKNTRDRFAEKLSQINGVKVVSHSSNFILCKVNGVASVSDICNKLLDQYGFLTRDVSKTINLGQNEYLKIAVNCEEENVALANAIHEILTQKSRITGMKIEINNTQSFFEQRGKKNLQHRYNYVIYHDSNPEIAVARDSYEKRKILPLLNITANSRILDIGCGVGRWADEFVKILEAGIYVGIDYSESLLKIAQKHFATYSSCFFYNSSFQNIDKCIRDNNLVEQYDTILINGVLMYINDEDLEKCVKHVKNVLKKGGVVYVKESVGVTDRFTLNDFYSSEMQMQYSAIYRGLDEYQQLFDKEFSKNEYRILEEGNTWNDEQWDRKETISYYWIIMKQSE